MIIIKINKKMTLLNIIELWLNNKNNLKIQSKQKYDSLINIYIKDEFRNISVNKLRINNFENYFNKLNNNSVSISIQKTILYIIKSSLNYGYTNKLCNYIEIDNIKFKNIQKFIFYL